MVGASDAYIDLVTEAHAYVTARQEELRRDFRLGEWRPASLAATLSRAARGAT